MNFTYANPLGYVPPIANAGENIVVIIPQTTAVLDGLLSNDPEGQALTYDWQQVFGPSTISFDNNTLVSPTISNLEKGIYKCKLTVSDGTYSANSFVFVLVQENANSNPTIHISSPSENDTFSEGTDIIITTAASDLDGTISKVEFYNNSTKLGEDTVVPFSYTWSGASVGEHQIKAVATDNDGGQGNSQVINLSVDEVLACSETSNQSQQGSFSVGYNATFATVGTSVTITFQLLDTNRAGVIAYLWKQSPFGETQMEQGSGLTFSKTIGGLTSGETISYACKFAFAGGLAVTKYISYQVGSTCSSLSISDVSLENSIIIYPNPLKNTMSINAASKKITKVEIFSTLGTLVKKASSNFNAINVEELSNGLYLIKIYTTNGFVIKKIIKE